MPRINRLDCLLNVDGTLIEQYNGILNCLHNNKSPLLNDFDYDSLAEGRLIALELIGNSIRVWRLKNGLHYKIVTNNRVSHCCAEIDRQLSQGMYNICSKVIGHFVNNHSSYELVSVNIFNDSFYFLWQDTRDRSKYDWSWLTTAGMCDYITKYNLRMFLENAENNLKKL